MDHDHGGGPGIAHGQAFGWDLFEALVVLVVVGAAVGYAVSLWATRGRSPWPVGRTVAWYAGLVCAGAGLVGPVASAAHTSFTAHMVGHLFLGMIAPLLPDAAPSAHLHPRAHQSLGPALWLGAQSAIGVSQGKQVGEAAILGLHLADAFDEAAEPVPGVRLGQRGLDGLGIGLHLLGEGSGDELVAGGERRNRVATPTLPR